MQMTATVRTSRWVSALFIIYTTLLLAFFAFTLWLCSELSVWGHGSVWRGLDGFGAIGMLLAAPAAIGGVALSHRAGRGLWHWTTVFGALPLAVAGLVTAVATSVDDAGPLLQAESTRRVLPEPLTVSGHTLPAGTTVAQRGDSLLVSLPPGGTFDGEPIVGTFELQHGGIVGDPLGLELAHDTTSHGLRCLAGKDRPFFLIGDMPSCDPAPPGIVDGVPCSPQANAMVSQDLTDGRRFGVECTLAGPYTAHGIVWPATTTVNTNSPIASFTTGRVTPALRVFGRPVPPGTTFSYGFAPGRLEIRTDDPAIVVHGCTVSSLMVDREKPALLPEPSGPCDRYGYGSAVGTSALTVAGKTVEW